MLEVGALPVTSLLTAALIVQLVILSLLVTARRAVLGGIQFGDAEDVELRHRIRAHGNFIEIVPIVIIALGVMELAGAPRDLLWLLAGGFFAGRVLHAIRMFARSLWPGLIAIVSQHLICLYAGYWIFRHFLF
ncbi:MAPEG family protein [Denitrobaculum tricleocarpae]|uniref:MAPEG family protein n=1 Tax=Denitrobaculum tricleocarpae TaxID=2591009 RepID=A0A545U2Z3_9PROT|nr:MAPEG family protein [Denitrobaculum tricleocarpae]TQV83794.1 hypothetical protein FKG95_04225 [Denitrobaculum tricleocarpae]